MKNEEKKLGESQENMLFQVPLCKYARSIMLINNFSITSQITV